MATATPSPALIAQAENLLALARSFRVACQERLSTLSDEWFAAQYGCEAPDDIDDQIGHWSALLQRCEHLIDAATL